MNEMAKKKLEIGKMPTVPGPLLSPALGQWVLPHIKQLLMFILYRAISLDGCIISLWGTLPIHPPRGVSDPFGRLIQALISVPSPPTEPRAAAAHPEVLTAFDAVLI